MNYWWVVASERDPEHGWHWDYFFSNPYVEGDRYDWGGVDWIRSTSSHARIEEMRKGDIVIAYQATEGVLGFVYLATNGYASKLSGRYDTFDLDPGAILRLETPISYSVIRELPQARKHFEFVGFHQGSVFRVSHKGFEMLLYIALEENDGQRKEMETFFAGGGLSEQQWVASDFIGALSLVEPPKRIKVETTRVIRDTAKTKRLKERYNHRCQVCGNRIEISPTKYYAEVHHIRPLGGTHMGLDDESNMIVVCPTHHAYFDYGVPKFLSGSEVIIGAKVFNLTSKHRLGEDNLNYHNQELFGRNV